MDWLSIWKISVLLSECLALLMLKKRKFKGCKMLSNNKVRTRVWIPLGRALMQVLIQVWIRVARWTFLLVRLAQILKLSIIHEKVDSFKMWVKDIQIHWYNLYNLELIQGQSRMLRQQVLNRWLPVIMHQQFKHLKWKIWLHNNKKKWLIESKLMVVKREIKNVPFFELKLKCYKFFGEYVIRYKVEN